MRAKPKLVILDPVKGPGTSYIRPLLPALEQHFDVELHEWVELSMVPTALDRCDVLWVDWATEHAALASRLNATARKPLLVRLHSFEALETDWPALIEWTEVTTCVAVGSYILRLAEDNFPSIRCCHRVVVPNGIDIDRFIPRADERPVDAPPKLAWVGDLAPKKDPTLALRIFVECLHDNPGATIHFAGPWTSLRTRLQVEHFIRRQGLNRQVVFDGIVRDMPTWFIDKDILLSTSPFESFGYAIGEAMAAGLDVIVMDYPGAEETWPTAVLASTIAEARGMIRASTRGAWVDFVRRQHPLVQQRERMTSLLLNLAADTRG